MARNDVKNMTFDALQHEYSILRSKHDSKIEAILILSKELDNFRNERDQFKMMAEQLQDKYSVLRKKVEGWGPSLLGTYDNAHLRDDGQQGLVQLLCEFKEQNKALKSQVEVLQAKRADADGDIKLLREQIARQRVGSFDEGFSSRSFPSHERETLVKDLEAVRLKCSMLESDLQAIIDEKEELITTRDEYKRKVERLNQQINLYLKGDEKKLIDIDTILMENRYLQERLKQTQEEKSLVATTLSKYKSMLEKKKSRMSSSQLADSSGAAVITHKQVQQLLREDLNNKFPDNSTNVADLRNLLVALYEALNDKKIALSHQKKANKILGTRVTQLEEKLLSLSSEIGPKNEASVPPSSAVMEPCSDDAVLRQSFASSSAECRTRMRNSNSLSTQSRTSSVCSEHADSEVFDDENINKNINSAFNSPMGHKSEQLNDNDADDELPPSLQKLVNAALNDINEDSPSKAAIIETSHCERRIRSRNNSSTSQSKSTVSFSLL